MSGPAAEERQDLAQDQVTAAVCTGGNCSAAAAAVGRRAGDAGGAPPGEPAAISFARRRALLSEKTSKPNNRCYQKPHGGLYENIGRPGPDPVGTAEAPPGRPGVSRCHDMDTTFLK